MKTNNLASRNWLPVAAALLSLGLFAGCATTVHLDDQAGTVGSYKYGYLVLKPNQPLARTHEAVKKAFHDLGYLQTSDEVTPGEVKLTATDQHDTSVSVDLKDYTDFTQVRIRYGTGGELAQEQEIYKAIERNFNNANNNGNNSGS